MRKVIKVGKADYNGDGRENCAVEIEVELKDGGVLSICGSIWQPNRRDILSGGQNLDTIAELFPNDAKVQRIVEVWKVWHLNDMRAACEHQRAAGFLSRAGEQVTLYNWRLTSDTMKRQREEKDGAMKALMAGKTVKLEPEGIALQSLSYSHKSFTESLPDDIAPFYELAKGTAIYDQPREVKTLGWLNVSEHPDGLLGRPCEVCGYKYGTKWLKEELPAEIVAEVQSW